VAESALQTVINALLSADADTVVGAVWGQRSPGRTAQRNGYRHRDLDTVPSAVSRCIVYDNLECELGVRSAPGIHGGCINPAKSYEAGTVAVELRIDTEFRLAWLDRHTKDRGRPAGVLDLTDVLSRGDHEARLLTNLPFDSVDQRFALLNAAARGRHVQLAEVSARCIAAALQRHEKEPLLLDQRGNPRPPNFHVRMLSCLAAPAQLSP
jgi:hypothetical protein